MKFYKYINYNKYINSTYIKTKKITCIYINRMIVYFYKNGMYHNSKNAAIIEVLYKEFCLNEEYYGDEYNFTKQSWRRFVKMKAFL